MPKHLSEIHFQLAAMAPNGSRKGQGKATARAKMSTLVINRRLLLDRDSIMGFSTEHICGLIWIYNVCGIQDERACDLFYDIIFLDPVITHDFSQFQLRGPHRRSKSSVFWEWWAAFRLYMWQMFDKTGYQMSSWREDNPRAFGERVDCFNAQTTHSGKDDSTCEHFS